jgi:hypothetical protein
MFSPHPTSLNSRHDTKQKPPPLQPPASLTAAQGDGEGMNEMNAAMDLLRRSLVAFQDRAATTRVFFPDAQELAVARSGQTMDPNAGRAALEAKFEGESESLRGGGVCVGGLSVQSRIQQHLHCRGARKTTNHPKPTNPPPSKLPAHKNNKTENTKFKFGVLTKQNALWSTIGVNLFGAAFDPAAVVRPEDELLFVAYPSFNPREELSATAALYERVGGGSRPDGRCVKCVVRVVSQCLMFCVCVHTAVRPLVPNQTTPPPL